MNRKSDASKKSKKVFPLGDANNENGLKMSCHGHLWKNARDVEILARHTATIVVVFNLFKGYIFK